MSNLGQLFSRIPITSTETADSDSSHSQWITWRGAASQLTGRSTRTVIFYRGALRLGCFFLTAVTHGKRASERRSSFWQSLHHHIRSMQWIALHKVLVVGLGWEGSGSTALFHHRANWLLESAALVELSMYCRRQLRAAWGSAVKNRLSGARPHRGLAIFSWWGRGHRENTFKQFAVSSPGRTSYVMRMPSAWPVVAAAPLRRVAGLCPLSRRASGFDAFWTPALPRRRPPYPRKPASAEQRRLRWAGAPASHQGWVAVGPRRWRHRAAWQLPVKHPVAAAMLPLKPGQAPRR